MLTENQFQRIKDFAADSGEPDHLYGSAILVDTDSPDLRPKGTLIINSRSTKPTDYFLSGDNIGNYPHSNYSKICLTRKFANGNTITLTIP